MSRRRSPAPRYVCTPDQRVIRRDDTEHECWLAIHTERERSYLVSIDGNSSSAVWVPKALIEMGEPNAGFQSVDVRNQRVLTPICWASGPGFLFDEKGLRPVPRSLLTGAL